MLGSSQVSAPNSKVVYVHATPRPWSMIGPFEAHCWFYGDSGMFAMVRGHGISAFPNTILIKTVSSGGESS